MWYPRLNLLKGKGVGVSIPVERMHRLNDKSIADVCEALIGAALLTGGLDMATQMVTAILRTEHHQVKAWKDYYPLYSIPAYQIGDCTASMLADAAQVERDFGYKFRYPRLLRSAFTHASHPTSWERIPCYERLEFLGDALIDQATVEDLWERFPGKDPQWMTEHKVCM
jgi:endoribonuclease Dicer